MGMTEGAFPWKEGQPSCKAGELDASAVNKAGAPRAQRMLVCVWGWCRRWKTPHLPCRKAWGAVDTGLGEGPGWT